MRDDRFEKNDILRIVRALATFRPSLIALQMPLTEEDEVRLLSPCFPSSRFLIYSSRGTDIRRTDFPTDPGRTQQTHLILRYPYRRLAQNGRDLFGRDRVLFVDGMETRGTSWDGECEWSDDEWGWESWRREIHLRGKALSLLLKGG